MSNKKQRSKTKKQLTLVSRNCGIVTAKGTTATGNNVVITAGGKSAQVLAATVGGAVLGNLVVPGIGGAVFGGLIGAMLGNGSRDKEGK